MRIPRCVPPLTDTRETEKVNRSADDFELMDGETQKCNYNCQLMSHTPQPPKLFVMHTLGILSSVAKIPTAAKVFLSF